MAERTDAAPVPTADLLAKLNAAGIASPYVTGRGVLEWEPPTDKRDGFFVAMVHSTYTRGKLAGQPYKRAEFRVPDAMARNAVTVAAETNLHGTGHYLIPPHDRLHFNGQWMLMEQRGSMHEFVASFRATDLCEAAVEAACRVRGGA